MIEQIVYDYLKNKGFSIHFSRPEINVEKPFLIIDRTGSGETDKVKRATITIQSYGSTKLEAMETNRNLLSCMRDIANETSVCRCILNNAYDYTDVRYKENRYQAVFELTYM